MNWFQRHLNWTWVLAYLIWFVLNASESVVVEVVAAVFLLIVSGWVIRRKGRRLWWLLLSWLFSPLWLKNKTIGRAAAGIERVARATDPYVILGLPPSASIKDVERRYRQLSNVYHPDKEGGFEEAMKLLNNAYREIKKAKK